GCRRGIAYRCSRRCAGDQLDRPHAFRHASQVIVAPRRKVTALAPGTGPGAKPPYAAINDDRVRTATKIYRVEVTYRRAQLHASSPEAGALEQGESRIGRGWRR